MKLAGATIFSLRIPFVEAFSHSSSARLHSDAIVVRVTAEPPRKVWSGWRSLGSVIQARLAGWWQLRLIKRLQSSASRGA